MKDIIFWSLIFSLFFYCCSTSLCKDLNFCSGHGRCVNNEFCVCDDGWGGQNDISIYKAPDCSLRTCPSGPAWADLPTVEGLAHNLAECSNGGICNRKTGQCECFDSFSGAACNRAKCPNDCSGHGVCKSMRRLAQQYSVNTTIYGSGVNVEFSDNTRQVSCKTDSSPST